MLQYCDEHFQEDTALYARLSLLMTQIDKDMKYYPHALLAYKVLLATRDMVPASSSQLQSMSQSSQTISQPQVSSTNKQAQETVTTTTPVEKVVQQSQQD